MHCDLSYIKNTLRLAFEGQLGSHALSGEPSVEHYPGGVVLPCRRASVVEYVFSGGVVSADGAFVEASALHERPCDVGGAYESEPERRDCAVIYIGFLMCMWGHEITDSLKKLWYLQTPEAKSLLGRGAKVAYVTMDNAPISDSQREVWRLAGHDCSDWLHVVSPTKFAEVIVPGNSFVAKPDETRLYFPQFVSEISRMKATVRDEAKRKGESGQPMPKRVYLTRTRLKSGKDYNERQLERLFESCGFTVVAPEQLSVSRQVWLMMNCDTVAATEGSVSHNALFMGKGKHLVVLQKADYLNGYQHVIDDLAGVEAVFIPAHHSSCASKDMPWAGPFYLCVTQELARWCGRGVRPSRVWLEPEYWQYRLRNAKWMRWFRLRLYLFVRNVLRASR